MVVVSINFSSLCTIAKLIFVSSVLERNEISTIHDSSLLSFVSHASAHARGNRKEKDKNERKGEKNKNSLATSHAIRRSLSHDQLYQRLRLYANGRRLISIMSINMFFFYLKMAGLVHQGGIERRPARKKGIKKFFDTLFRDMME